MLARMCSNLTEDMFIILTCRVHSHKTISAEYLIHYVQSIVFTLHLNNMVLSTYINVSLHLSNATLKVTAVVTGSCNFIMVITVFASQGLPLHRLQGLITINFWHFPLPNKSGNLFLLHADTASQ